jgi:hypothetical protein
MISQPGRSVSDTQPDVPIVPVAKDITIRDALIALCFALFPLVLVVVAYFGYSGVFDNLGMNSSTQYDMFWAFLFLFGISGLSAIVIGTHALRASHQIQLRPGRALILARIAIALGFIESAIAFFIAVLVYGLRDSGF